MNESNIDHRIWGDWGGPHAIARKYDPGVMKWLETHDPGPLLKEAGSLKGDLDKMKAPAAAHSYVTASMKYTAYGVAILNAGVGASMASFKARTWPSPSIAFLWAPAR